MRKVPPYPEGLWGYPERWVQPLRREKVIDCPEGMSQASMICIEETHKCRSISFQHCLQEQFIQAPPLDKGEADKCVSRLQDGRQFEPCIDKAFLQTFIPLANRMDMPVGFCSQCPFLHIAPIRLDDSGNDPKGRPPVAVTFGVKDLHRSSPRFASTRNELANQGYMPSRMR